MTNPGLMDKDVVARLCEKSKRLSGAKWKWRRICEKHHLTWQQVEEKYDIIIQRQEEALEKLRGNTRNELGAAIEGDSSQGTESTRVSWDEPPRASDTIDGKEIRSGEASDGTTTPGSTE